ncbi:hypothetical protein EAI_05690 [Harpegnathos saltator]|uniref:Uncharacterized protein n=1 Tax=Harpegnathos saltator TaxID=610380 RepID=E2BHZ4_HARSA|nr:hypothetical protein EAI_05690 [Harpegnathos saltator]
MVDVCVVDWLQQKNVNGSGVHHVKLYILIGSHNKICSTGPRKKNSTESITKIQQSSQQDSQHRSTQ